MGVTRLDSRLEVLCKLDWVDKLDFNSIVYVTIPSIAVPVQGTIRFIGTLPEEVGTKFGIELLEKRGEGTSDGTLQNVRYFKCERGCAEFVSMDNLTTKDVAKFAIPLATLPDNPITLKNKVKIFDKLGNPLYGRVKWIGKKQQVDALGIEVEEEVDLADFPEHIQDEKYKECFTVADGHSKLLLPAHLVTKEDTADDYVTDNIPDNGSSDGMTSENYIPVVADDKALSEIRIQRPKYLTQGYRNEQRDRKRLSSLSSSCSPNSKLVTGNPNNFKVGALIQFGNPPCYGVIKWIGLLPSYGCLMAGVEVEKPLEADKKYNDGWHQGVQYFQSEVNRGHFLPLVALHPDQRQKALGDGKCSTNSSITQLYQNPENQLKGLQSTHDNKLISVESTINLCQKVDEVSTDFQSIKEQIKAMEANINKMLAINEQLQADNNELKTSNAHLQNQVTSIEQRLECVQQSNAELKTQLSLTQQQLIGMQSMVTHSRLWVVSHDQFVVGKEIGRGAWATVHTTTFRGNLVAAKCLHNIITSPETREMFKQEMEMALHCQHENIVTFLGATLEGDVVILMELMDISLRKAYEQNSVRDDQRFRIFYDVAKALHFLHTKSNPVIHRDVSSANVLLKDCDNAQWLAKLGDLGTAKILWQCTTPGPGTIAYAAPEATDPREHSPKMDVYSYGIVVLETLTTTFPFKGKLDTLKSSAQQQFPRYYQLISTCLNHQSTVRPTMHDIMIQLDNIATACQ